MVTAPPLRVAFFGTPDFAVPALNVLLASRHQVVVAVSQPDRARGRGQRTMPTPVKAAADAAAVPVLQPERLKEPPFPDAFAALQADLGVVAAYGKILPEWLITLPRLGMINVHASLLPRYRGAAPIQRAVLAGETGTGVTIMRIVKELDAGPMFASVARPIQEDATAEDVERDLAHAGAPLLLEVVEALAGGTAVETPQDNRLATYAPKIARDEGLIRWERTAREIHNQVRGLTPWPHAWTHAGAHRVLVIATSVERSGDGMPGEILEASGDVLLVAAGQGAVRLHRVQPEGRRVLTAREFLAGHRLTRGARLT
jgi:methionyl-tRNA formyltransferase